MEFAVVSDQPIEPQQVTENSHKFTWGNSTVQPVVQHPACQREIRRPKGHFTYSSLLLTCRETKDLSNKYSPFYRLNEFRFHTAKNLHTFLVALSQEKRDELRNISFLQYTNSVNSHNIEPSHSHIFSVLSTCTNLEDLTVGVSRDTQRAAGQSAHYNLTLLQREWRHFHTNFARKVRPIGVKNFNVLSIDGDHTVNLGEALPEHIASYFRNHLGAIAPNFFQDNRQIRYDIRALSQKVTKAPPPHTGNGTYEYKVQHALWAAQLHHAGDDPRYPSCELTPWGTHDSGLASMQPIVNGRLTWNIAKVLDIVYENTNQRPNEIRCYVA